MAERFDAIVVGSGIVGLSVARTLLQRRPGSTVLVVDKEKSAGAHQTGHNSGVIHSGVYYKPGSLKASLCVQGARSMIEYCKDRDLPLKIDGKLVVAVRESEIAALDELQRRSEANGVPNVTRLGPAGIAEIEPNAVGLEALHVPGTGATVYVAVAEAFADDIRAGGGEVTYGFEVSAINVDLDLVAVRSADERTVLAKEVVVCAGVQSDRLVSLQGKVSKDEDVRIIPFRGSYYDLKPEAATRVKSMIYPVPDPRFPFLGVHFTRHSDDTVSCGPNAVLALSRETYKRRAVNVGDALETLRFPGMWKLGRRYWQEGFAEIKRDFSYKRFVAEAQRYMPSITEDDLVPGGMGLRAQAVDRTGKLIDDFAFVRRGLVTHVQNAPSPAATASIAVGAHIVDQLTSSS